MLSMLDPLVGIIYKRESGRLGQAASVCLGYDAVDFGHCLLRFFSIEFVMDPHSRKIVFDFSDDHVFTFF